LMTFSVSMIVSLITANSIAEPPKKSTINLTLFHLIKESFFNNFLFLAPVGTVPL
jgi:hypothetical protein